LSKHNVQDLEVMDSYMP